MQRTAHPRRRRFVLSHAFSFALCHLFPIGWWVLCAAAGTRIEELEVLEIKADFAYGGPCGDDAISVRNLFPFASLSSLPHRASF